MHWSKKISSLNVLCLKVMRCFWNKRSRRLWINKLRVTSKMFDWSKLSKASKEHFNKEKTRDYQIKQRYSFALTCRIRRKVFEKINQLYCSLLRAMCFLNLNAFLLKVLNFHYDINLDCIYMQYVWINAVNLTSLYVECTNCFEFWKFICIFWDKNSKKNFGRLQIPPLTETKTYPETFKSLLA